MNPIRITESDSRYDHLELMSVQEILNHMNEEDHGVPYAVQKVIPQIEKLVQVIIHQMHLGGKVFYIGAGTSGRLGILDASEIPPTFGVGEDKFIGLIAGGDGAIRKAVEFAEDDTLQAWKDLEKRNINERDVVIGIAASGNTPYVVGGIREAKLHGLKTGALVCNLGSILGREAEFPIEVVVGPEFITGSTRLKSGTAQKLILNMVSTSVMIKMGRIKGNKMIDMQLTNTKLVERGVRMIMMATDMNEHNASRLLEKHKNVRKAIDEFFANKKN